MADYPDFEQTCGYGSVTGIGGANCRHSFWPYIEGVSERTYTDEELEAMKPENRPKIEFEGKEYDDYQASQMQRSLERSIRKQQRRKIAFEAAGLTEEAQAANIRLRRLNEKYHQFSRAAGLPEQRERLRALEPAEPLRPPKHPKALENKEQKTQAQNLPAGFAKQEKSAILTEEETGAVKWYIGGSPYEINWKLREGIPLDAAEAAQAQALDRALEKLPVYQGKVIRDLSFFSDEEFQKFAKDFALDNEVVMHAFTSATTLGSYQDAPQVRMVIQAKNARDLRMFNQGEGEVLFPRGTVFKMRGVRREGNMFILEVEEL